MKTGFLQGPFTANTELLSAGTVYKIAVQSKPGHQLKLNDILFELGNTGTLQFRDSKITSIKFMQDEDSHANIAYLLN